MRARLFRMEMRLRSLLRLDCAGCIEREDRRVGSTGTNYFPSGTFRLSRPVAYRGGNWRGNAVRPPEKE